MYCVSDANINDFSAKAWHKNKKISGNRLTIAAETYFPSVIIHQEQLHP